MRNIELAKSIEVKLPDFQKDVIIPQIYDLENIKLIQSCRQAESPPNKVQLLKKNNIEKVIHSIVYKMAPSTKKESPLWKSRAPPPQLKQSTVYSNASHSKLIESLSKQELFVDLDHEVGETVMTNEQNFAPFAERVRNILARVHYESKNRDLVEKEREVQQFILGIGGNPRKRLNPEPFRKVPGMLESMNQINFRESSPRKIKRASSAGVIRNKTNDQLKPSKPSVRLLSGVHRSCNNLKKAAKLQGQTQTAKVIIRKINDYLESQQETKKRSFGRMKSMGQQWGEKGQLQKTMASIGEDRWNKSTLEILRQRRLKGCALQSIDNSLFSR